MSKLSIIQARNAVIVAFVLGLTFSIIQIGFDLSNERDSLDRQVSRMLETIKASATRAVFNVDRGLAENVVDSLLKFLPIYSARLVDDFGEVLSAREKEQTEMRYSWLTDYLPVYRSGYTLKLTSEQNDRSFGHIEIKVFGDQIVENFVERSILVLIFGTLRNFLLAIALTLIFHYTLTRHLAMMTHQISRRDPAELEGEHVDVPKGHENDELGELADKFNFYLQTSTDLFRKLTEAERKTRRSEARFRSLAETGSDWFWEMGPDLRYVSLEGYTGQIDSTPGQRSPIGQSRWEAVKVRLPDFEIADQEKWRRHIEDFEQHRPIRNFQYAAALADGELAYVRMNATPIFDKTGNFSGYHGTGANITEEAKYKNALEISEKRYRDIFSNAQSGIALSTIADGKMVQANERAAEILGYKNAEDLIENYCGNESWVVPHQREKMTKILLEDGFIPEVQAEVNCPDGSRRWIRASLSLDKEEGMLNSFFVDATEHIHALDELARLNTDLEIQVSNRTRALSDEIIERTQAEESRRHSETRLLTAIEAITDGFMLYDSDDRLVLANSWMQKLSPGLEDNFMLGRTFEEITRKAIAAGLFPDAVGREDAWLAEALERRSQSDIQSREIQIKDGRWVRLMDARTPDGGHVGVRTDITELKQAHEELKAAQSDLMLKERLAALGQLAASVSHELRNPLGAMQSSTYFLRHRMANADEKNLQALERIERNIRRCDRIIDELLDFTRKRDLDLAKIDFNSWLHETVADMEHPSDVQIIEDLTATKASVTLDHEYFRRVIVNLFDNACQAMTKMDGSEALERRILTISTSVVDDRLALKFDDTGVGMTAEIQQRIFEPMFSTKGFGVGLGLALARQIVERHEGDIMVVSTPGKGTGITVSLPLAAE